MERDKYFFISATICAIIGIISAVFMEKNELMPYVVLASVLASMLFCAFGFIESI